MVKIVLASGSPARIAILRNAGVEFTIKPANIDERAIEAPLAASGELPRKIAAALAEEKALATANSEPDALVIGGDQILLADGRRWNKPANLAEARDQLMTLSGRSHELFSSIAVVRAGAVGVAVITAVLAASSPSGAARGLRRALDAAYARERVPRSR